MEARPVIPLNGEVKQFVLHNFYVTDQRRFDDDTSLIDQGIVDSTGVLELVHFIEEHYHIRVEDEELVPDNLDSINRIARYVSRKMPAASPPCTAAAGPSPLGLA